MNKLTFTPLTDGEEFSARRGRGHKSAPISLIIDNTCRVYITQIPFSRIERDGVNALRSEFEAFGPVEAYKMFTDRSGRFIGTVLCTYRNPADASAAVQHMNDQNIDGSILKVSLSRDHGVVLLHNADGGEQSHASGNDSVDGKWKHDRYHDGTQESTDSVRGGRGFGRGHSFPFRNGRGGPHMRRGGGRGRGLGGRSSGFPGRDVDEAFERYIASRDAQRRAGSPNENEGDPTGEVACETEAAEVVCEVVGDIGNDSAQVPEADNAPAEAVAGNEES